jgi:hypothetical protein
LLGAKGFFISAEAVEREVGQIGELQKAKREFAVGMRARRGIRRFTISVTADNLRVIAEHGYEDAASTDQCGGFQVLFRATPPGADNRLGFAKLTWKDTQYGRYWPPADES